MVYQVVVSLIYTLVLGQQQQSPNTERLMAIAKQMPVFIILISVVGPILEEFVFRKVFLVNYTTLSKVIVSLPF